MSKLPPLSGCILEISRPLREALDSRNAQMAAVGLAVVAWNASQSSDVDKANRSFRRLVTALRIKDLELIVELRKSLDDMIERRRTLFPDDNRFCAHYYIHTVANVPHLEVVAVLEEPEDELAGTIPPEEDAE